MTNTGTPALLLEARSAAAARHATGRAGGTEGCSRCSLRLADGAPPAFLTETDDAGAGACRGVPGATDAAAAAAL